MVAGLKIYNTGGTIQIDENWKNYGYQYKVPVTVTSYDTSPPNPTGFNGATYQLALSGTPQLLVACKAADLLPVKQFSYYSGGTWYLTWLFMKQLGVFGAVTETVNFYVFDAMAGSGATVGLKVYNAAGEVVFDSSVRPMKVGSLGNAGIQPCNVPFSGDSGHTYVPLILTAPFVTANVGSGNRHFSYGNRSVGSNILAEGTPQLGSTASLAGIVDLPGLYAAIDVTGL